MKYYYSKTLDLYISYGPLTLDSQVAAAANACGIPLHWDDFGRINQISFAEAKQLTAAMGGSILSPAEYWKVYKEAECNKDIDFLNSLISNHFTEFLDRVYMDGDRYIDHPTVCEDNTFKGNIVCAAAPVGRPGWIYPGDINLDDGHPVRVFKENSDPNFIKYWSPDLSVTPSRICFPIRGYVTSVANISLDLGIPIVARQPKLMIRFCTKNPPADYLSAEEKARLTDLQSCDDMTEALAFLESSLYKKICASDDNDVLKIKENLTNHFGLLSVKTRLSGDRSVPTAPRGCITGADLTNYILRSKSILEDALQSQKKIVFIIGHQNPDTDTVISSLLEGYRFSLLNDDNQTVFLPLIQADSMPDEIRALLDDLLPDDAAAGGCLCDHFLYSSDIAPEKLLSNGLVRFVYTDQNYQAAFQKYVTAITDHHKLSSSLSDEQITFPCRIESVGSATSLIARRCFGEGLDFDEKVSYILYGAMLMDTENRAPHKMTDSDRDIMNLMRHKLAPDKAFLSDDELYSGLMHHLVSEKNVPLIFNRDYKLYKGFGFAVLKVSGYQNSEDEVTLVSEAIRLAKADLKNKHTYFTLLKIVFYNDGGIVVRKERILAVFAGKTSNIIRAKLFELLQVIVRLSFPDSGISSECINKDVQGIEVSGSGKQLSRKKIAPAIEQLLTAYSRFVYMKSINKWVAVDFLTDSGRLTAIPHETDSKNRICLIRFDDARRAASLLGGSLLSLSEFWAVYHEAEKEEISELLDSMTSGDFIEYIDSCSRNGLIGEHMSSQTKDGWVKKPIIPAVPGLIDPDEIDEMSGLPTYVHNPDDYENKKLWRYWSPPAQGTYVFSRSHIFLIDQPCLDAKMMPTEAFINLGMRLVRDICPAVDVRIEVQNSDLVLMSKSEFDEAYQEIFRDRGFAEL